VLGYLDPHGRLGGEVKVDAGRAGEAIRINVAEPLGLELVEAAAGIHRIVCEHMAAAAKIHAVEKGRDVRHYALLAFGGAGPIFARSVARYAGCSKVIVPPHAGVFSALGLLAAPIKFDAVQSRYSRLADTCWADIEAMYCEMEGTLAQNLEGSGADARAITHRRSADMRYVGQGFEITVPIHGSLSLHAEQKVTTAFNDLYQRKFGNFIPDGQIEILNWRVDASATIPWPDVLRLSNLPDPERGRTIRPVYFPELDGFHETPIYRDPALAASEREQGPLLIEQAGSTIVIGPGDRFDVDKFGNVLIAVAARK